MKPRPPVVRDDDTGALINEGAAGGAGSDVPHKLWGGRFAGGPSPLLDAINRSIGVDFRLWPFDVQLSKAWAVALWNAGVLTLE